MKRARIRWGKNPALRAVATWGLAALWFGFCEAAEARGAEANSDRVVLAIHAPSARGCAMSNEPARNSVEHALGIFAVLLLFARLLRVRARTPHDDTDRGRIPYVNLRIRESAPSLSDDGGPL